MEYKILNKIDPVTLHKTSKCFMCIGSVTMIGFSAVLFQLIKMLYYLDNMRFIPNHLIFFFKKIGLALTLSKCILSTLILYLNKRVLGFWIAVLNPGTLGDVLACG